MEPFYVPILKAKQGEYDALYHLSNRASQYIIPWFDIPKIDERYVQRCKGRSEPPIETFLNDVASGIAKAWANKSIFLDLPRWRPDAQTENGEHVIPYLFNRLELHNVSVFPVVDYVRWSDHVYENAIQSIRFNTDHEFCLRLVMDADTIEEMNEPEYFIDQLVNIVESLGISYKETTVLLDYGDVSTQKHSVEKILENTKYAISLVGAHGFSNIMLAGCSLPSFINLAVKNQNDTGLVLRKEMMTWRTLLSENINIIFSDYGVRSPNSGDECTSRLGNGKIRYTIDNEYFIVRGYPLNHGLKGIQHHTLAQTVINSKYFSGENFSWGDRRILECSKGIFSGRPQDWIAIDTNHHIEAVLDEIIEFRRRLVTHKVTHSA